MRPLLTKTFFTRLLLGFLAPLATSCGLLHPAPTPRAKPVLYDWHDDGGPGEVSVKIDLSKQIAVYHRSGREIGWSFVSTGKEGHATATGSYAIMEKLPLKTSDCYGWIADEFGNVTNGNAQPSTPVPPGNHYTGAPMNYWMRITAYGVGMHAGEIPQPGEAASHGCIRLPRDFVPKLYEVTQIGTPVEIISGKRKRQCN
jgi:lipoprotein-anchoring transpeptidase ErfK/SrfK